MYFYECDLKLHIPSLADGCMLLEEFLPTLDKIYIKFIFSFVLENNVIIKKKCRLLNTYSYNFKISMYEGFKINYSPNNKDNCILINISLKILLSV